jgi:acetyl esterase/lipase
MKLPRSSSPSSTTFILILLLLFLLVTWIWIHSPKGLMFCAIKGGCMEHNLMDALLGLFANAFGDDPTQFSRKDVEAIRRYGDKQDAAQRSLEKFLSDDKVLAIPYRTMTIVETGLRLFIYNDKQILNATISHQQQLRPVFVVYHGGGTIHGYANDGIPLVLVSELDVIVVSVDYALFPNKFPKPCQDSYQGLKWTYDHIQELGGDPTRIAVMGVSAGGLMTACTVGLAHDQQNSNYLMSKKIPIIQLQVLIVPMITPILDFNTIRVWEEHILSAKLNTWFWSMYVGSEHDNDGGGRLNLYECVLNPICNPMARNDFTGFPKTIIVIGTNDVLAPAALAYHEKLLKFNVPSKVIPLNGSHLVLAFDQQLYKIVRGLKGEI